jgi:hypothetical protein
MRHAPGFVLGSLPLAAPAFVAGKTDRLDADHVLLISVDGLHALDVSRFVEGRPRGPARPGRVLTDLVAIL